MKLESFETGQVVHIDELMDIADKIDRHNAAVLGCSVEDLDDDMICERHGVSLHVHECEGIDF